MTSVRAVLLAIAAALLYAVSIAVSKLLLGRISPTMLAGLLYLGAGAGLMFLKAAITGKDEIDKRRCSRTIVVTVFSQQTPLLCLQWSIKFRVKQVRP